jgi:hypothetical protein
MFNFVNSTYYSLRPPQTEYTLRLTQEPVFEWIPGEENVRGCLLIVLNAKINQFAANARLVQQ